jgi:multidrug efflux pump subunit AcrA (membrane-fusion protein)
VLSAVLLLPALTAASCGDEPTGITLGAAARTDIAEIVEAPGAVTARGAATLSAPADGTLGDLRVEAGQRVTKGTVVAVIDSPAAEKRLADAERALDQSSSGGAPASGGDYAAVRHRTDKRAGKAFDNAREAAADVTDTEVRAALLAQVDAAEEQYAAASETAAAAIRSVDRSVAGLSRAVGALTSAQRLQAQQAYDLAAAAVDALTLKAPVTGTVQLGGTPSAGTPSLTDLLAGGAGAAQASASGAGTALPGVDSAVPEGAVVSAGTPIATIVDVARLGLAAEVDETDVLLVKAGGPATVELDAATGATYPATVRAVDLLPTTSARGGVSYRVRLDLGKGTYSDGAAAPAPRPGMSAVVRLRVREAADAVTVPASAILNADGRDTVWVIRGGKAERAPVTLGVQGEDVVEITEGLGEGQRIVIGGADQVSAGQDLP